MPVRLFPFHGTNFRNRRRGTTVTCRSVRPCIRLWCSLSGCRWQQRLVLRKDNPWSGNRCGDICLGTQQGHPCSSGTIRCRLPRGWKQKSVLSHLLFRWRNESIEKSNKPIKKSIGHTCFILNTFAQNTNRLSYWPFFLEIESAENSRPIQSISLQK